MLIEHDPDKYEVVITQRTCDHHKRNPKDVAWPGCTCGGTYGYKLKGSDDATTNPR